VLSSHLLFSYADRLDLAFHREAIAELMRVARGQLRIFPLVGSPVPHPLLGELLDQLAADGISGQVVAVDYEFHAGGNQMLVCSKPLPCTGTGTVSPTLLRLTITPYRRVVPTKQVRAEADFWRSYSP
jgi:hypothetical protein